MTLDLADDRRRRVGGELDAAPEVKTVDRLDQADGRDLNEVVKRLAPVAETSGEVLDERQVQLHQLIAELASADLVVAATGELGKELFGPQAVGSALVTTGSRRWCLIGR